MNYKDEIKAVAFDFDGTLIDFEYKATSYTHEALRLLSESKYTLALASGRPCFLALKTFKEYFPDCRMDYVFGCNGSEVMDVKKDKIDILFPLQKQEVRDLGSKLDDPICTLGIYDGQTFLVNHEVKDPVIIEWMNARWLTPVLFDYSKNEDVRSKVLLLSNPKDRKKVEELLAKTDLSDYNSFFSSKICYEIAPKGISKAKSCQVLADILNCDLKQILSFGDMENDLDMLMVTTGVAMGNASKEIKDLIPLHTDDVQSTGIYKFLKDNSLI